MNTEITKISDVKRFEGWVLYDDQCAVCTDLAARFAPVLRRRGLALAPLPGEAKTEMRVELADGRTFGGAHAVVFLAGRVWWAWPLVLLSKMPGAMPVLQRGYRWIAEHRHCVGGACKIAPSPVRNPVAEELLDDLLD